MPRSHHLLAAAVAAVVVVVMGWSARPCEASLYQPPPPAMAYHDGAVLEGAVPVSVLYYGAFPPHHRAVVADFLMSLSPRGRDHQPHTFGAPGPAPPPTVARWWGTVERYVRKAGRGGGAGVARVVLASQVDDEGAPRERLSRARSSGWRRLGVAPGGVAVVTAADVAVEGSAAPAARRSSPGGGAVRGGRRVGAVPRPVRVAVPRRGLRRRRRRPPPPRARPRRGAPRAERRRRGGRRGDQPGGADGRRGDEPVRARLLPGRRGGAGGGGRSVPGGVRPRRVPGIPGRREGGRGHRRRVQRRRPERPAIPRAGARRPGQLLLPHHDL
ncbi:hypothetical protein EE612_051015, partial [Oryza sativa]